MARLQTQAVRFQVVLTITLCSSSAVGLWLPPRSWKSPEGWVGEVGRDRAVSCPKITLTEILSWRTILDSSSLNKWLKLWVTDSLDKVLGRAWREADSAVSSLSKAKLASLLHIKIHAAIMRFLTAIKAALVFSFACFHVY